MLCTPRVDMVGGGLMCGTISPIEEERRRCAHRKSTNACSEILGGQQCIPKGMTSFGYCWGPVLKRQVPIICGLNPVRDGKFGGKAFTNAAEDEGQPTVSSLCLKSIVFSSCIGRVGRADRAGRAGLAGRVGGSGGAGRCGAVAWIVTEIIIVILKVQQALSPAIPAALRAGAVAGLLLDCLLIFLKWSRQVPHQLQSPNQQTFQQSCPQHVPHTNPQRSPQPWGADIPLARSCSGTPCVLHACVCK